jgi:hypothetical protein
VLVNADASGNDRLTPALPPFSHGSHNGSDDNDYEHDDHLAAHYDQYYNDNDDDDAAPDHHDDDGPQCACPRRCHTWSPGGWLMGIDRRAQSRRVWL